MPVSQWSPGLGEERGASAVLIAFSMILIMGFAAIAVDAGIAFEDRRQQQAAADTGALAAIQFAKTETHADCPNTLPNDDLAACRGAAEARDVVDGTLAGRYSDGDWAGLRGLVKACRVHTDVHHWWRSFRERLHFLHV